MKQRKQAFTLIELIVVMAVIGILVLLAVPKFLGYTERARETKHIHTAKVIETALEAYLINGGAFPDDLEVVEATLLSDAVNKKTLIGVDGYVKTLDDEVYYELTYDFIRKIDVKISASNGLFVEAMASSVPTAVYASEKGIAMVDKEKTMKGYELKPGELPNEIKPVELKKIQAGDEFTLALMNDGHVFGWGVGFALGSGDYVRSTVPVPVKTSNTEMLSGIVDISAGETHSLALKDDGTVWAWGYNTKGELGNGTTASSLYAVKVQDVNDAIQVEAAKYASYALMKDGTIKGWGWNEIGQLGDGTIANRYTPVSMLEIDDAIQISSSYVHAMILTRDGKVRSVGSNNYGELGIGTIGGRSSSPQAVKWDNGEDVVNAKAVAAGVGISLILLEDGKVASFGNSSLYALGDGTAVNRANPKVIPGLDDVIRIRTYSSSMVELSDGTLKSWGVNSSGQLGDGTTTNNNKIRTVTAINGRVLDFESKNANAFAILPSGEIKAWGRNNQGQLGDNTRTDRAYAVSVVNSNGTIFNLNQE